jgi:hypothetical protein
VAYKFLYNFETLLGTKWHTSFLLLFRELEKLVFLNPENLKMDEFLLNTTFEIILK